MKNADSAAGDGRDFDAEGDEQVRFQIGESHLDVRVDVGHRGEPVLMIRGERALKLLPDAANCVLVEIEKRRGREG